MLNSSFCKLINCLYVACAFVSTNLSLVNANPLTPLISDNAYFNFFVSPLVCFITTFTASNSFVNGLKVLSNFTCPSCSYCFFISFIAFSDFINDFSSIFILVAFVFILFIFSFILSKLENTFEKLVFDNSSFILFIFFIRLFNPLSLKFILISLFSKSLTNLSYCCLISFSLFIFN